MVKKLPEKAALRGPVSPFDQMVAQMTGIAFTEPKEPDVKTERTKSVPKAQERQRQQDVSLSPNHNRIVSPRTRFSVPVFLKPPVKDKIGRTAEVPAENTVTQTLYMEYRFLTSRSCRPERISDQEIAKLLPANLRKPFKDKTVSPELYNAVREILDKCPPATGPVHISEIGGNRINGVAVEINIELRAARRQISERIAKLYIGRDHAIRVLKQNGYDDDKYLCMLQKYQRNKFIPRQTVAELLNGIDKHLQPLSPPSRRLRNVNVVAEQTDTQSINGYRKLPVLSVAFRNVVHCEGQRTAVDMHVISSLFPPSAREQFSKFVNAGGMRHSGELEMTDEILQLTKSIYKILPAWQAPASEREERGVQVGELYIHPLMSFSTAKRQLTDFNRVAGKEQKETIKRSLIQKGFDAREVDQLLELATADKHSVSRTLVANIIREIA